MFGGSGVWEGGSGFLYILWCSSGVGATVASFFVSFLQCGPCRGFTPQLIKTYENVRATGKSFQIVFVSSDRDEAAMKEYYNSMPWLTLPFGDPRKKTLSRLFDISGERGKLLCKL